MFGAANEYKEKEKETVATLTKEHQLKWLLGRCKRRQMQIILNKAEKTHKRRVEDFNRHLDTLTEHYDIPKVILTRGILDHFNF